METTRRQLIGGILAALATTAVTKPAFAQAFSFTPNQRYPDPSVEILDPSFTKYRIYSSTLEQLATGMRWAEGPVYFPEGRYVRAGSGFLNGLDKWRFCLTAARMAAEQERR